MPDEMIHIEIQGLDELKRALARFPQQAGKYLQQAGDEAASRIIIRTEGLKTYPPITAANAPPTPYYIRGRGMQYASGNTNTSERLKTQFYTKKSGAYSTEIGNRASYAKFVVGEEQAYFMKPKGWRKLADVAREKMADINKIYDAWIEKLLRDIGLK